MGQFNNQTILYLTKGSAGPATVQSLMAQGLPVEQAQIRSNFYLYRDSIYIPLGPLGTMKRTDQVFSKELGSGAARNLKLPTTLQLAFFNYLIFCYVDFGLDPTLNTEDNALNAMFLAQAVNLYMKATRVTIELNQSKVLDVSLAEFSNYETPSFVTGLVGEASNAPVAQFPPTFQNHHRVYLELDPCIIWPPVGNVIIAITTDIPGYWNDIAPASLVPFDITVAPWNIQLQPTLSFSFVGDQGQSLM